MFCGCEHRSARCRSVQNRFVLKSAVNIPVSLGAVRCVFYVSERSTVAEYNHIFKTRLCSFTVKHIDISFIIKNVVASSV
jgi:hypothetical protein